MKYTALRTSELFQRTKMETFPFNGKNYTYTELYHLLDKDLMRLYLIAILEKDNNQCCRVKERILAILNNKNQEEKSHS